MIRFWLGLALSSFLEIPTTFSLKIDEILTWAGPEQFPSNSYYILIDEINEIVVRAGPEHFLLNSNYILIEN